MAKDRNQEGRRRAQLQWEGEGEPGGRWGLVCLP